MIAIFMFHFVYCKATLQPIKLWFNKEFPSAAGSVAGNIQPSVMIDDYFVQM